MSRKEVENVFVACFVGENGKSYFKGTLSRSAKLLHNAAFEKSVAVLNNRYKKSNWLLSTRVRVRVAATCLSSVKGALSRHFCCFRQKLYRNPFSIAFNPVENIALKLGLFCKKSNPWYIFSFALKMGSKTLKN